MLLLISLGCAVFCVVFVNNAVALDEAEGYRNEGLLFINVLLAVFIGIVAVATFVYSIAKLFDAGC